MRGDTEYTFRNSATDLLTKKGKEIIEAELKKLKCKQCGSDLGIITYMEGDYVICKSGGERHETGYDIKAWNHPLGIVNPPIVLEKAGAKIIETCSICKGTKIMLTGPVCEYCDGKGRIERDSFSPLSEENHG